jgi:hypothetical protein
METFTKTPFFTRTLCYLLLILIGINITGRITSNYLSLPPAGAIFIALLWLAGILTANIILKRKVRKGNIATGNVQAVWEGGLRYLIALDMLIFGVGKIFHKQFRVPLGMFDSPLTSLSGDMQLWAFFGQHYSYTVIIASLQIASGLLLLFRRTRLFGLIFLLPIMLNIVLLNQYYDFDIMVDQYSILTLLAITYLIMLEYSRLVVFFFKQQDSLPNYDFKTLVLKRSMKLIICFIPLLLVAYARLPLFFPAYSGKYIVTTLTINGKAVNAPLSSGDSVLTTLYIDGSDDDFVMDYNDYRRRRIGNYDYNKIDSSFKVIWRYPAALHDTLYARLLSGHNPIDKILQGRMGGESFSIRLHKVK